MNESGSKREAGTPAQVPTWTESFDMSSIPEAVLKSEWARRSVAKRHSYTGGVFWKKHNAETPRCRCRECMEARQRLEPK